MIQRLLIVLINISVMASTSPLTTLAPLITSPVTCDFESGLCGWEDLSQTNYSFRLGEGPTADRTSGPETDHSLPGAGTGHYVYTTGWDAPSPREVSRLRSPVWGCPYPCRLSFWYHMNGNGIGNLSVHKAQFRRGMAVSSFQQVWLRSGRQGMEWRHADVPLLSGYWQIEFRTTVKHNYGSDIALDDITIAPQNYTTITLETIKPSVDTTVIETFTAPETTFETSKAPVTATAQDTTSVTKTTRAPETTETTTVAEPQTTLETTKALETATVVDTTTTRAPKTTIVPIETTTVPEYFTAPETTFEMTIASETATAQDTTSATKTSTFQYTTREPETTTATETTALDISSFQDTTREPETTMAAEPAIDPNTTKAQNPTKASATTYNTVPETTIASQATKAKDIRDTKISTVIISVVVVAVVLILIVTVAVVWQKYLRKDTTDSIPGDSFTLSVNSHTKDSAQSVEVNRVTHL